jgi:hypothetical protein
MRSLSFPLSAIATALVFAALPVMPRTAEANTGVIRCERPDGTRVYTSGSCGQFGAASAPIEAELANRIVSEHRTEARLGALRDGRDPAQAIAALEAGSALASRTPGQRRSAASGCARTPQQLAMDLQASVALGDVNRVAESFDWAGMQSRQANQVMHQLEGLAERSIARAEYFDITVGASLASASDAGVMQVAFRGDGGTVIDDFEVRRDSGCYFLRFA